MALFNSVAAGLAIITTRTRAAVDYLTSPENCLWVPPQNSNRVHDAMQTLLGEPSLVANMKQHNLLKGQEFSKEQVASELAAIINKAIKL
jgi:glycosyltransferase involved in cell wall biosynthesis